LNDETSPKDARASGTRAGDRRRAGREATRVPVQFRLPDDIREFLREEANERRTTQTDVVIEALGLLRRQRLEALMAEGYREMAEADLALAEEFWPIDRETWPQW
jgi:hypothetical protein